MMEQQLSPLLIYFTIIIIMTAILAAAVSRIIKKANADYEDNIELFLSPLESYFIAGFIGLVVVFLFVDPDLATWDELLRKLTKPFVVSILAGYQAPRIFIMSEKAFQNYLKKKIKELKHKESLEKKS